MTYRVNAILPRCLNSYCREKGVEILQVLLPEETSRHVQATCAEISLRIAMEKVDLWMNMHITPGEHAHHARCVFGV